jgi:hypothetical protein
MPIKPTPMDGSLGDDVDMHEMKEAGALIHHVLL